MLRRRGTIELFPSDSYRPRSQSLSAALQLQTRARGGCASVLLPLAYCRRRIPVCLSDTPKDSSTAFSYACGMSVCSPVLRDVPVPRVPKEGTCPATRLWDVCRGVWDLMSGLSGAGQNRHREEDVSKLTASTYPADAPMRRIISAKHDTCAKPAVPRHAHPRTRPSFVFQWSACVQM